MNGQFISFNNQSDFGDIVRIYRDCQHISQEQFAEMIGVSQRAVANWENGRIPETKNMQKVLQLPNFIEACKDYYKGRAF